MEKVAIITNIARIITESSTSSESDSDSEMEEILTILLFGNIIWQSSWLKIRLYCRLFSGSSRASFSFAILCCAVVTAGSDDKIYDVMILSQCYRSVLRWILERLYSAASTSSQLRNTAYIDIEYSQRITECSQHSELSMRCGHLLYVVRSHAQAFIDF